MPKSSPNLAVEEFPGDTYRSLAEAQQAALKATAGELAAVIRSLIDSGILIVENGRIIPADPQER